MDPRGVSGEGARALASVLEGALWNGVTKKFRLLVRLLTSYLRARLGMLLSAGSAHVRLLC